MANSKLFPTGSLFLLHGYFCLPSKLFNYICFLPWPALKNLPWFSDVFFSEFTFHFILSNWVHFQQSLDDLTVGLLKTLSLPCSLNLVHTIENFSIMNSSPTSWLQFLIVLKCPVYFYFWQIIPVCLYTFNNYVFLVDHWIYTSLYHLYVFICILKCKDLLVKCHDLCWPRRGSNLLQLALLSKFSFHYIWITTLSDTSIL